MLVIVLLFKRSPPPGKDPSLPIGDTKVDRLIYNGVLWMFNYSNGVHTEKLCADGMVFNDYNVHEEKCDLPYNIDCSQRPNLREYLQRSRKFSKMKVTLENYPKFKDCEGPEIYY